MAAGEIVFNSMIGYEEYSRSAQQDGVVFDMRGLEGSEIDSFLIFEDSLHGTVNQAGLVIGRLNGSRSTRVLVKCPRVK